jgi:hypothetical protein
MSLLASSAGVAIYMGTDSPTWALVAFIVIALGFLACAIYALVMTIRIYREDRASRASDAPRSPSATRPQRTKRPTLHKEGGASVGSATGAHLLGRRGSA